MAIKFCEVSLSANLGEGKGIIGVISKSFGRASVALSCVYAILLLALSFVMGAALQSSSVGQCVSETLAAKPLFVALFWTLLILFAIIKGKDKISKITAIIIPLTTIIYISLSILCIFKNFDRLGPAFVNVMKNAFKIESALGGAVGYCLSSKIREGYLRGILSNEAGAGTSTLAHASNSSRDPVAVGVMGICEVFFDTVVLCTLTAFAVLVSTDDPTGISGVRIIVLTIGSAFGTVSEILLLMCVFSFAYSTVICWYYYGSEAYEYLMRAKSGRAYLSLFLAFSFFGVFVKGDILVGITDVLLFFLSSISLFTLMKNSDRIVALSEKSGLIPPMRKCRAKKTSTRRKYIREDRP